mmetsp:Transcript_42363/g.105506  ORF Transcript_42363/g.105506 Transcript_42363/m.105506 type:complete len:233 (-) Transcript_42363:485-1183(-)
MPKQHFLLGLLAARAAFAQNIFPQTPFDPKVLAFNAWISNIERVRRLSPQECAEGVAASYTPNATFVFQNQGNVVGTFEGAATIGQALCLTLQAMDNAQVGLAFVEHCNGVWRGAFGPPFYNATGNAFSAAISNDEFETNIRPFKIDGYIDDSGKFVATYDYSCVGFCSLPDYDWSCNKNCVSWCNAYTCGLDSCKGCSVCDDIATGSYCASWCNPFTCGTSYCEGCTSCTA